MKLINTEKAPGAIGPYSQGFEVNGIVYTSGQIPVNPADGTVPEGIAAQAEQSCKNVGAILEAAGSGYDKVIKTTCFLADMGDFAAFNEVYAKYFTSKPARSCVAVKSLPKVCLLYTSPSPRDRTRCSFFSLKMEVGNAPGGALQAVKRLEQNGKRCKAIYQVRRGFKYEE